MVRHLQEQVADRQCSMYTVLNSRIFSNQVNTFIMENLVNPGFQGRSTFKDPISYLIDGRQNGVGINIKGLLLQQPLFVHSFMDEVSEAVE